MSLLHVPARKEENLPYGVQIQYAKDQRRSPLACHSHRTGLSGL